MTTSAAKKTVSTDSTLEGKHYLVLTKEDLFKCDSLNSNEELALANYNEAVKLAEVCVTVDDHGEAYIFLLVKVAKPSIILEDYK